MSKYQELRERVEKLACERCHGTGELDDMGPGDIFYNTWKCDACGGTGLKLHQLKYYRITIDGPGSSGEIVHAMSELFHQDFSKFVKDWNDTNDSHAQPFIKIDETA